ncbi:hypothetical protein GGS20DRAFT_58451 [Poronia punctata]|nr:hypothetical protein GGS20DRAFT_58451 [Poronia punctata]
MAGLPFYVLLPLLVHFHRSCNLTKSLLVGQPRHILCKDYIDEKGGVKISFSGSCQMDQSGFTRCNETLAKFHCAHAIWWRAIRCKLVVYLLLT